MTLKTILGNIQSEIEKVIMQGHLFTIIHASFWFDFYVDTGVRSSALFWLFRTASLLKSFLRFGRCINPMFDFQIWTGHKLHHFCGFLGLWRLNSLWKGVSNVTKCLFNFPKKKIWIFRSHKKLVKYVTPHWQGFYHFECLLMTLELIINASLTLIMMSFENVRVWT